MCWVYVVMYSTSEELGAKERNTYGFGRWIFIIASGGLGDLYIQPDSCHQLPHLPPK